MPKKRNRILIYIGYYFGLSTIFIILLATAKPCMASDDSGQGLSINVKPKLLTGDRYHLWTPALGYDAGYRDLNFRNMKVWDLGTLIDIALTGTVADNKSLNTEGIVSKVSFGLDILSGKPAVHAYNPAEVNKPQVAEEKGYWGSLGLTATVRHESDQTFDEQQVSGGAELMYINSKTSGVWSLIPSAIVAYEYVDPFRSDVRDNLNLQKKGFERVRFEASLKCTLGEYMAAYPKLQPFVLHLDYRYFRDQNTGENKVIRDQETTTYRAATVSYHLSTVAYFIGVSDGRMPTGTKDETVVHIGVLMPLDKIANKIGH